jgi:hypothetical protein
VIRAVQDPVGEAGVVGQRRRRQSAICTALSAAPLRRLSATTHIVEPFSTVGSLRMRLT